MAKNTHHGKPLSFISLTPAAMQPPAKVAKVKAQGAGRMCKDLGVCNAKGCADCADHPDHPDQKALAAMATADAAEAAYWQGQADFAAGKPLHCAPDGLRVTMANEAAWVEGWLDAQAKLGHPPPPAPDHHQLARQDLAQAFLFVLLAAALMGAMLWHSIRADARVASHAVAQVQESAR